MTHISKWIYLGAVMTACGDDTPEKRDAAARDSADSRRGTGGMGAGSGGTTGRGGAGGALGTGGSPTDAGPDAAMVDAPMAHDTPLAVDTRESAADLARLDNGLDVGGTARVCGPFADGSSGVDAAAAHSPMMSFFVSSTTSPTGDLGGLAGADQRCQSLAAAVGLPSPFWRAYLSVEHDPPGSGAPGHARDRIGTGPWYNSRGALVAVDVASLHARPGDTSVFLDEHGKMINGQWTGSPGPNEHDILTGSNPDGTVAPGKTCADWTSAVGPADGGVPDGGGGLVARVGHSDGIGPQCSTATSPTDYTSWNSSHDNAGCNDTAPRGGAGRIYCFKAN